MIWTLILVPISVLGVWLAARHWYGWAISLVSEFLWGAYAISLHSTSLLVMSFVWAFIHARNTIRTYRDSHPKEVAWWDLIVPYESLRIDNIHADFSNVRRLRRQ